MILVFWVFRSVVSGYSVETICRKGSSKPSNSRCANATETRDIRLAGYRGTPELTRGLHALGCGSWLCCCEKKDRVGEGCPAIDRVHRIVFMVLRIHRNNPRSDSSYLWQELVEPEDEVFVSPENRLDSLDDALGVDPVCGWGGDGW